MFNSRIIEFQEKPSVPKSTLASTACYLFTREDIRFLRDFVKSGVKFDNLGDFVCQLAAKKPVYGVVYEKGWFDIGSFELYDKANVYFSK